MSRTVDQMQQRLEAMLNELGADHAVIRVTLQCFLANLVAARGPEMLEDMKRQVLDAIGRTEPHEADPQGGERRKQLTLMRAELLFQEIEEAIGLAAKWSDPSASN